MRAIVTAIVFFKQRTVCIVNVWGCAEILPQLKACYLPLKVAQLDFFGSHPPNFNRLLLHCPSSDGLATSLIN